MTDVLQVLTEKGDVDSSLIPDLTEERMVELYRQMLTVRQLDTRMLNLQRQGRIGFYGTCKGQEAATVGSGAAVGPDDWVFPALREGGEVRELALPHQARRSAPVGAVEAEDDDTFPVDCLGPRRLGCGQGHRGDTEGAHQGQKER